MRVSQVVLGLGVAALPSSASSASPLLGPGYPAPRDISSHGSPAFQGWSKMVATVESYLNQSSSAVINGNRTFSIAAFSLQDPKAQQVFQYHHTAPWVRNSTMGVKTVNGDTSYRIGSISKLFTVYTVLAKLGSSYWSRPITDFVPELAAVSNSTTFNPILTVDWKTVTLGALAGQLSGITRDILDISFLIANPVKFGFPPLNITDPNAVGCASNLNCTRAQYFKEIVERHPVYAPWTTPTYSNTAYDLLAFAAETITGKNFTELLQEEVLGPLGMRSSGDGVPRNPSNAVAAGNLSSWKIHAGYSAPGGGIYSSANDLSMLAISILNSTLLDPETTREWLKPITHTSALNFSVGRPWEIYRYIQPSTQRVNDLYTKSGDISSSDYTNGGLFSSDAYSYDADIVISPDHQAGFAILTAGPSGSASTHTYLADVVTNTFINSLEVAAAQEAETKLAGTYKSVDTSVNSSITFKVDPSSGPGLVIDSWISNGTNEIAVLSQLRVQSTNNIDLRLYPTDLKVQKDASWGQYSSRDRNFSSNAAAVEQLAFRAAITSHRPVVLGPFSAASNSWESVDVGDYGKASVDSFVFDLDKDGNGLVVDNKGLRAVMRKVQH